MHTLKCKSSRRPPPLPPPRPLLLNPATVASSPETTTHLQKPRRQTTVLTKPLYLYLLSSTHTKHVLVTHVLMEDSHVHSRVSLLLVRAQDMRICRKFNTCLCCVIQNFLHTNRRVCCTTVSIVNDLSLSHVKIKLLR